MPLEKCDQPPIKSRRYQRLASRLRLTGLQADVSDSEKGAQPGVPSARDFCFARDEVEVQLLERSERRTGVILLSQPGHE